MSEIASWNGEQPQIKLLDPVLFEQLGAGGGQYAELLLAEYGRPGQVIERGEVPHGILHYIIGVQNPAGECVQAGYARQVGASESTGGRNHHSRGEFRAGVGDDGVDSAIAAHRDDAGYVALHKYGWLIHA